MDTRRFNNRPRENININSSSIPVVVVLLVGCCLIVLGVVLIAALGVPTTSFGKEYAGVIAIAIGCVVCVIGSLISCYIKSLNSRRAQRRISPTPKESEQYETTSRTHTTNDVMSDHSDMNSVTNENYKAV